MAAAFAETVRKPCIRGRDTSVGIRRTTFVLALEEKGSRGSSGSRGSVCTSGLGWCLLRAQVRKCGGMRSRDRMERILQRMLQSRLGTPGDMVKLGHVFIIHEPAAYVPDTYSIIDTKARALSGRQNMLAIRAPLAVSAVGGLDSADFAIVLLEIIDVHLASQISKTSDQNKATVGREKNSVPRRKIKIVLRNSTGVKDGGLCRHVAINHAEFLRIGRPSNIVDWAFLVCLKSALLRIRAARAHT
jgi:hypothetical protein